MLTFSLLKPPTPRQHLLTRWYTFVPSLSCRATGLPI